MDSTTGSRRNTLAVQFSLSAQCTVQFTLAAQCSNQFSLASQSTVQFSPGCSTCTALLWTVNYTNQMCDAELQLMNFCEQGDISDNWEPQFMTIIRNYRNALTSKNNHMDEFWFGVSMLTFPPPHTKGWKVHFCSFENAKCTSAEYRRVRQVVESARKSLLLLWALRYQQRNHVKRLSILPAPQYQGCPPGIERLKNNNLKFSASFGRIIPDYGCLLLYFLMEKCD